jgi:DNA repair exonuclease SbcCD ATPase subunit
MPKANAAWQDVEQVLQQEPDLHVLKILIADARAADAARIAALEQQLTALPTTAAWQDVVAILLRYGMEYPLRPYYDADAVDKARAADAQQIAQYHDRTIWAEARVQSLQGQIAVADGQIAALRAENEKLKSMLDPQDTRSFAALEQAEAQLTALQAENEGWRKAMEDKENLLRLADAAIAALQAEQAQWQREKEKLQAWREGKLLSAAMEKRPCSCGTSAICPVHESWKIR